MALPGLIGRKLGMTQVYTAEGVLVPVTVIQAGPCTVIATRQRERDGYAAAQLGFGTAKPSRLQKAVQGQFKKAGTGAFTVLREFRLLGDEPPAVGAEVRVSEVFQPGEVVHVAGLSKGRGTHEYFRHGGSIGNRSYPGRIFKGKRMAGRYGAEWVTTRNLKVIAVRPEENLLLVRGAVPGARNGTVLIHKHAVEAREA